MRILRSLAARGQTTVSAHWRALVITVAVLALSTTGGVVAWTVAEPVSSPAATQGGAATSPSPRSTLTPSESASASAFGNTDPKPGEAEESAPEEEEAVPPAADPPVADPVSPAPAKAAPAPAAPPASTPAAPAPSAPAPAAPTPVASAAPEAAYVAEVLQLVNAERAKAGLSPLTMSASLNSSAAAHASWMASTGTFQHGTLPSGWSTAGENIARGQTSAASVVAAWMASDGHRANILRSTFTNMGVGYVASGNWWCQQFGG